MMKPIEGDLCYYPRMADSHSSPQQRILSPSAFMRARRSHLFSDGELERAVTLPKVTFEYQLETLTSRKQEYEFEHFCRKLAEKELCPNLRVQTGPTGGGGQ